MTRTGIYLLFMCLIQCLLGASPPVPFSGKVSIDSVNYHGQAKFAFAIRDKDGAIHWRNGNQNDSTIDVSVTNGRYVVLLGGQGMNALPATLFLEHDELYLRVRFDAMDGRACAI